MNQQLSIEQEINQLEDYLNKYPEAARELAVNHYEDYLVLKSEYKLLKSGKKQTNFVDAKLSLSQKFVIEAFKRNDIKTKEKQRFYAIKWFKNHLYLAKAYQREEASMEKISLPKSS